jgi:hypothetical protein
MQILNKPLGKALLEKLTVAQVVKKILTLKLPN